MHSLYSKELTIPTEKPLVAIVQHFYNSPQYSKTVIVTTNPRGMDGPLRKRWNMLVRYKREAKARALRSPDFAPLAKQLQAMEAVSFGKIPENTLEHTITLGTIQQFLQYPPKCQTMYVIGKISTEELRKLTAHMTEEAVVVRLDTGE